MKRNYALAFIGMCLLVLCGAFIKETVTGQSFDNAKREIALREIGHRVLLSSGDSTSRVLPVVKLADDEFQIQFDQRFTFQTDTLVNIVKRALTSSGYSSNYIVNVVECNKPAVLFGYAVLATEKKNNGVNNLVPCSGRRQPVKCYRINIKFQNKDLTTAQVGYVIGSLPLLAFVGLIVYRSKNNNHKTNAIEPQQLSDQPNIELGMFTFCTDKKTLHLGQTEIPITSKEAKLLAIFAAAPNQIIDRRRLQKEIWEDEGVIVGRSLDMFVSKLRKKLKDDPNINLANIHGKGYRLEVS